MQHPNTVRMNELRNEVVWGCCGHRCDGSIPTKNNKPGSRRRLKCWSKRWKVKKLKKTVMGKMGKMGKEEEWRKRERKKVVLLCLAPLGKGMV